MSEINKIIKNIVWDDVWGEMSEGEKIDTSIKLIMDGDVKVKNKNEVVAFLNAKAMKTY